MKRAIIFYNGNKSDLKNAKHYIRKTDYIICADGGTKHALKLGIVPDVIIGDFDSLPNTTQRKLENQSIEWVRFNKEKDETDSELALRFAVEKGYTSLLIFGLFGTRLDHLLTNIFALTYIEKLGARGTIIEGDQEIYITDKKISIEGNVGDLVSLLPINSNALGVTTKGLEYKLDNETLHFGYSRGISNVMTKETAAISINDGVLMVIHTKL